MIMRTTESNDSACVWAFCHYAFRRFRGRMVSSKGDIVLYIKGPWPRSCPVLVFPHKTVGDKIDILSCYTQNFSKSTLQFQNGKLHSSQR